ncbi:adult-specific cuticular protein ACP-22-like [Atheta coriaria]|uniref:adult-specific cuticular protein ACP-22-like n=1 Tax=Dalotia coriaria TaxID=877792 RepID=UPI0031F3A4FB
MKVICLLFAIVAVAWAYPDGHGHKVNHNDQGGGHKYEFHGHGHEGGHKATSYHKIERHDSKDHPIHFKAHPVYHYGFKVADDKHHDHKDKHEEREGDKVKGSYSLLEPDGKTIRVVEYTADHKQGWNAKVSYKHHH